MKQVPWLVKGVRGRIHRLAPEVLAKHLHNTGGFKIVEGVIYSKWLHNEGGKEYVILQPSELKEVISEHLPKGLRTKAHINGVYDKLKEVNNEY